MSSEVEELRKRYGDRKAFEWFMRAEDKRHFRMAEREIENSKKQMTEIVERKIKKTTALIAVSTVVWMLMMFIFYIRLIMLESCCCH